MPATAPPNTVTTSTTCRAIWWPRIISGGIERWCRDHGIALTGHLLLEESLLFHVMFSGSMVKDYQRMDMPGVDLLLAVPYHTMPFGSTPPSAQHPFGVPSAPEDFSCKLASSMSHLSGKKGTISESFALATHLR